MIDLLPPHVKEQKHYGRLNRLLVRYIAAFAVTALIIAGIFSASWWLLRSNESETDAKLAAAQAQNTKYTTVEREAKTLADRLSSIEEVQKQQTHFTDLLKEVSAVTPSGVYIYSLQVSAEAGSSLRIAAFAESDQAAANFKNSLERSSRFASAALQSLDDDKDPYTGKASKRLNITVGLKEGALK